MAQVFEPADRMPQPRFRVLVLLTAFGSLRWGEVTALRRRDIATDGSTVRIAFTHTEVVGRGIVEHLAEFVESAEDALVFSGVHGGALGRERGANE